MNPVADIDSADEFTDQANALQRMVQVDVERIAGSYIMGDDSPATDFQLASQECIKKDAMAASLEATLQHELKEGDATRTSQWMLYEIGRLRYIVTVDMQLYQKVAQEYENLDRNHTTILEYPEDHLECQHLSRIETAEIRSIKLVRDNALNILNVVHIIIL